MHCVFWDPDASEELYSYLSNVSGSNTCIQILCPLGASLPNSLHDLEQGACNLENRLSPISYLATVATNTNASISAAAVPCIATPFVAPTCISEAIEQETKTKYYYLKLIIIQRHIGFLSRGIVARAYDCLFSTRIQLQRNRACYASYNIIKPLLIEFIYEKDSSDILNCVYRLKDMQNEWPHASITQGRTKQH